MDITFVEIFVGVSSDFHDSVEHLVATSLASNLYLLFKLIDLAKSIIKLHLQIVPFENDCL